VRDEHWSQPNMNIPVFGFPDSALTHLFPRPHSWHSACDGGRRRRAGVPEGG
jgi:hypothetical protein